MEQVKGVILAAGVGSRLRPLTDKIPKPLVPFCGIPIFYLAVSRLLKAGIKDFATNAHYMWEKVAEAADENPFGVKIHVSLEKDLLLGSGGVYGNLAKWRQNSPILAVNGDVVSDYDISALVSEHITVKPWATLGLVAGKNPKGNSVWIDRNRRVVAIAPDCPPLVEPATPHVFSGFQVLSDDILQSFAPNRPADLIKTFQEGLASGKRIIGLFQDCFWHDLGTPFSYFAAHREFLENLPLSVETQSQRTLGFWETAKAMGLDIRIYRERSTQGIDGPSLFLGDITLGPGARVGPFVVAACDLELRSAARLENAIIFGQPSHVHEGYSTHVIAQDGVVTQIHD